MREGTSQLSKAQIINQYLRDHRSLVKKHNEEITGLFEDRMRKIQKNDGVENLHILQEYNLKMLLLLGKQKYERERFNRRHISNN